MTALSPNNVALYYANRYYKTDEEYLVALADAMHEEYRAIVDAGFLLQIDDPRLATHYDRHPEHQRRGMPQVHRAAGRGDQSRAARHPRGPRRFHTCYSTNVAPRVHDLELQALRRPDAEDQRAGATRFEAANPRHEHEWQVWEEVKLPDDKVLIPGVVSHCVALVEHPELVAQRIVRFAERGRPRARDRIERLRLRHLRRRRRGASGCRLGQARGAGRGRATRQRAALAQLRRNFGERTRGKLGVLPPPERGRHRRPSAAVLA